VVKGVVITMEAKTNKFNVIKPLKELANSKKKNSKKPLHQFYSDKKTKNNYHDFSPSVTNLPLHESDLFNSGLMMTATRPSESDFSMGEFKENQDFLSSMGESKRKLSSSLQGIAEGFADVRRKIESVELTESVPYNVTSSTIVGDNPFPQVPMTRHNSETLTGTSFDASSAPRRLSSFSSSFYSGTNNRDKMRLALGPEVKIAFFTFPGRE